MRIANLPLHYGHTPRWLFEKMCKLAREIVEILVLEYGNRRFFECISNPYWFQSFACVLGFDWHSSGSTTVVMGALKNANLEDIGIYVAGGKGRVAINTLNEIGSRENILGKNTEKLKFVSRATAKIDNVLIQDNYHLYHHTLVFDEHGKWAVVQQGMNTKNGYARRYHWLYTDERMLIEKEHNIACDRKEDIVLNMTGIKSKENRDVCIDIVREGKHKIRHYMHELITRKNSILRFFNRKHTILHMPRNINWKALNEIYEEYPKKFDEIAYHKGIGRETVRALSLIAEIIYGKEADWSDPVKFSYTHGGKDGVPYPINRKIYESSINTLKEVIEKLTIGKKEKKNILNKLVNV